MFSEETRNKEFIPGLCRQQRLILLADLTKGEICFTSGGPGRGGGGFSERGNRGGEEGDPGQSFQSLNLPFILGERGRGWDYRTLSDRTDRHAIAFNLSYR